MRGKLIIIVFLLIFINIDIKSFAHHIDIKNKNVLIINSYDNQDDWENNVLQGYYDSTKYEDINVDIEYLDIRKNNSEIYIETFENFINKKYKEVDIDLVLTVDDEAFNLVRGNIFNKQSIFYKIPTIFVGVNNDISLNEEERNYITGLKNIENQSKVINLITDLNPNINNINILLDNTIYSEQIKKSLNKQAYLIEENLNINFIQGDYIQDILPHIKKINKDKEVVLISGIFKDKDTSKSPDLNEIISMISNENKGIHIYTDRQDYCLEGAIGGYVYIGRQNGKVLGKMSLEILKEDSVKNIPIVSKPSGSYMFDYEEIYINGINPLDIPENSIILNKKFYQLLIPSQIKAIIVVSVILMMAILVSLAIVLRNQKKENKENEKLYKEAKEREQLQTDFIVNMSHELRTPLNVILSISKLLELKASKDEIDSEYLIDKANKISQNSSRLTRLVNNLIDITKIESGFYEYRPQKANIVYVIEDIVLESIDYANQKEINLTFDTEEEEIITYIDKEKIERAILNLLSNAIKFTHINGNIEVFVKKEDENVTITVSDNGIGISEEKLKRIFHRFYQIDSSLSRSNEGSGIGLCIVDEIIKMHEGKIEVFSKVDEGTNFKITLPIQYNAVVMDNKSIKNINFKDTVKLEMSDIDK